MYRLRGEPVNAGSWFSDRDFIGEIVVDEMEVGRCSCGLVFYSIDYSLNHVCLGHPDTTDDEPCAAIDAASSSMPFSAPLLRTLPSQATSFFRGMSVVAVTIVLLGWFFGRGGYWPG